MASYFKTLQIAKEMDFDPREAALCRIRFLQPLLDFYKQDYFCDDELNRFVARRWGGEIEEEINYLNKNTIHQREFDPINDIDDARIERARDYPLEKLIDFKNGVALAFCHQDNSPSLSLHRKANRARCFVCDKSFNSVDVMMEVFGFSFIDAVKALT
jgi:hypothetical protein